MTVTDVAAPDLARWATELSSPAWQDPVRRRVIAFAKQKGGVGNTTITVNVGAELARLGARVLICDMDPQRNSTVLTGTLGQEGGVADDGTEIENDPSLAEVLRGKLDLADVIVQADHYWQPNPDVPFDKGGAYIPGGEVWVAPASHMLRTALNGSLNPLAPLYKAVRPIAENFDAILIDCRPGTDNLVLASLNAAGWWLTTTEPETLSLQGLLTQADFIEAFLADSPDHTGRWAGVIVSKVDTRQKEHTDRTRDIYAWAQANLPERSPSGPHSPATPTVGGIWAPALPDRAAIKKSNTLPARPVSYALRALADENSSSLERLSVKRSVAPVVPIITGYAMNVLRLTQTDALTRVLHQAAIDQEVPEGILSSPDPIHADGGKEN